MKDEKFSRVLRLLIRLQSGQSFTVDELAKTLGIVRRTVFRDLKTLKSAGVPCYYDRKTYHHKIDPSFFFPAPDLTKRETLALLLLALKAKDYVYFPFKNSALQAAAKIESNLPPAIRQYCNAVLQNVLIKSEPQVQTASIDKTFEQLQQAILKKRIVSIGYWLSDEHMNIVTDLYPHQLIYDSDIWYVIGRSSRHKAIHAFKLNHIRELKTLNKCFFEEDNFGADDYLGRAWSIKRGGILYNIKLKFSSEIAQDVAEVQWHSTQTADFQNDGSAIIEFRVDGLSEIIFWILGYGDRVEVLAPQILRKKIVGMAHSVVKKNEQKCHPDIRDIAPQPYTSIVKLSQSPLSVQSPSELGLAE